MAKRKRQHRQSNKSSGGLGAGYPFSYAGGLTLENQDIAGNKWGFATAFQSVVAVNRAVSLIAQSLERLDYQIKRYDDMGNVITVASSEDRRASHPVLTAFKRSRQRYGISLLQQVSYSDNIYGNTFVELIRNDYDFPADLRWLNPLGVTPTIINGRIERYQYSFNGQTTEYLTSAQVAHKRKFNPADDLLGHSPVMAALNAANIDRNLKRFLRAFFRNNARPGLVVSPTEKNSLAPNQVEMIRDQLQAFFKGTDNGFSTLVTPVPMSTTPFEQPDIDKFYSIDDPITREIFAAFGVPMSMAGFTGEVASYKEGDEVLRQFYLNTILPHALDIQDFFNVQVMPFFDATGTYWLEFDTSGFDRIGESELNAMALGTQGYSGGILTLNEARVTAGYDEIENGDIFSNGITITQLSAGTPAITVTSPTVPQLPASTAITADDTDKSEAPQDTSIILSFANNPDLQELQSRLKELYGATDIQWTSPTEYHATLATMPAIPPDVMQDFLHELSELDYPDLSLNIGSVNSFDNVGQHALHFLIRRNVALLDYQAKIAELCTEYGISMGTYSKPENYTPHITMGYSANRIPRVTFRSKLRVSPDCMKVTVKTDDGYKTVLQVPEPDMPIDHKHIHLPEFPTCDYTPEKALAELDAWKTFVRNGTHLKRAFNSEYLAGDIADAIQSAIDDNSINADVWTRYADSLRPKLPELERAFVALVTGDIENATKTLDKIQRDFIGRFNAVLADIRSGGLTDRRRAGSIIRQLIKIFGSRAYRQGMMDAGIDEAPDDVEQDEILRLEQRQPEYISELTDVLIKGDGISDAQAAQKAEQWFNKSITPFYYAGLKSGGDNGLFEWTLGNTEEHCTDCLRLNGQRHRLKDWRRQGWQPQGDMLECGGWKCDCRFRRVTGRARGAY